MFFICTAISFINGGAFFGRSLDFEHGFGESIVFMPRRFPLRFREIPKNRSHHAVIGTAFVNEGYPLFYDGMNEHGLFAAGLNFPKSAVYKPKNECSYNVAPFEFIPWILAECADINEAKSKIEHANILSTDFSKDLSSTPLHWFIADKNGSLAVEPTAKGLMIHENPVGVLTNEPPFEYQLMNLQNFLSINPYEPESRFFEKLEITPYSRGMGGLGLPGDLSSSSRFVRAAFVKSNSLSGKTEEENVTQFFHILGSVEQPEGCVRLKNGDLEKTIYSCCISSESKVFYYRSYENSRITAVDMKKENAESDLLVSYPFLKKQDILFQN